MSLSPATRSDLRRIAAVAAFAAYIGVTVTLFHYETQIQSRGEALDQRHRAIESELLGVNLALHRLERATEAQPSLTSRLREKREQVSEEQRETTVEYDTWKAQSSAWRVKRWFVLAIVSLAFLPVIVWGYRSWDLWARDKRIDRPLDP
jgi:hypothetical protein